MGKQKIKIKNIMMYKGCCVPLCLLNYLVFHDVKHVEKQREHAEGVMDKIVIEQVQ